MTEYFATAFILSAVADWWMDMIQRTTTLISRSGGYSAHSAGPYLNPTFIRFAFPITLIKLGVAAGWAFYDPVAYAIIAVVASWALNVVSPVPAALTLRPIRKQIERVRQADAELGEQLQKITDSWASQGGRY